MAISFTNNWKNILDKLESILKTEFKGAIPVFRGKPANAGSQYLRLEPLGSSLIEYNVSSELREFEIEMTYHFKDPNMKKNSLDHVFRQVSRIEALIHDNTVMTLADSSTAYNCRLDTTTLNTDEEEEAYIVEWSWNGQHTGNVG